METLTKARAIELAQRAVESTPTNEQIRVYYTNAYGQHCIVGKIIKLAGFTPPASHSKHAGCKITGIPSSFFERQGLAIEEDALSYLHGLQYRVDHAISSWDDAVNLMAQTTAGN